MVLEGWTDTILKETISFVMKEIVFLPSRIIRKSCKVTFQAIYTFHPALVKV